MKQYPEILGSAKASLGQSCYKRDGSNLRWDGAARRARTNSAPARNCSMRRPVAIRGMFMTLDGVHHEIMEFPPAIKVEAEPRLLATGQVQIPHNKINYNYSLIPCGTDVAGLKARVEDDDPALKEFFDNRVFDCSKAHIRPS